MNFRAMLYRNLIIMSLIPVISNNNINKNLSEKNNFKLISSTEDLKKIYTDEVSFDDLRENINLNENISDEYKDYTNQFIDLIEEKYPDFDLTIFNENIKQFKINELTMEEIQKDHPNRQSFFRIKECTIYMHNEYKNDEIKKYCYFHELWHMFSNFYIIKDGNIYYKTTTMYDLDGTAIDEGFTTLLTESICDENLLSYANQYDEVKILYTIFGDELLLEYLNHGVEGVEFFLSKYIGYNKSSNLITLINDELVNKTNSIDIYNELIELYLKSNECNSINNMKIYEIIENVCYDIKTKQQILNIYRDYMCNIEINDEKLITFDNKNYYQIGDLYFVTIDDKKYLINDEILISFYKDGYIRNIYDEDKIYIDNYNITVDSFKNYVMYNAILFNEIDNIIYIDKNIIEESLGEKKYVKNK